jgi:hypothetical protein
MYHLRDQGKGNGRVQGFHFCNELRAPRQGSAKEEADSLARYVAYPCPKPLLRRQLVADNGPVAQIADLRASLYFQARFDHVVRVRKGF